MVVNDYYYWSAEARYGEVILIALALTVIRVFETLKIVSLRAKDWNLIDCCCNELDC